jgi:hypothetical protein
MASAIICAFCNGAADASSTKLGEMLGPIGHAASGDPIYVHRQCALWSPEVTCSGTPCAGDDVLCRTAADFHVQKQSCVRCAADLLN